MQTISHSTYKDVSAVTLENEALKVQFLPGLGGKMVSFIDKKTSREFLVQAPDPGYKVLEYDGSYVDAECSGFDDMFPTIDRAYYPSFPWKGIEMPDHGEVCGLKWDYQIERDFLYMCVYGVRFPYKLEKWVRFNAGNLLNIEYKATNLSGFDLDFIWAAHPMINSEEGGEILLPYQGKQEAIHMFSSNGMLGNHGDIISWPLEELNDGGKGTTYKYYFKNKMPEGWCAYRYPSDGTTLKLSFPEKKVPYLGVWVNQGDFKNYYNIALEMCTGSLDRPDIARIYGQNSILKANGVYDWFLNFEVN